MRPATVSKPPSSTLVDRIRRDRGQAQRGKAGLAPTAPLDESRLAHGGATGGRGEAESGRGRGSLGFTPTKVKPDRGELLHGLAERLLPLRVDRQQVGV